MSREQEQVRNQQRAAAQTDPLGPGTAGHTIAGAAYRGQEVAAGIGAPSPADTGFPVDRVGLHPGQGVGAESTAGAKADALTGQDINAAARLEGRSAVEMLTSPVEGETPENREP